MPERRVRVLGNRSNHAIKNSTHCCALAHLCGLGNNIDEKYLQEILKAQKREALGNKQVYFGKSTGQTALFTIVTYPDEAILQEKLERAGFEHVHTFKRRVGYPEGELHMMIKNVI